MMKRIIQQKCWLDNQSQTIANQLHLLDEV